MKRCRGKNNMDTAPRWVMIGDLPKHQFQPQLGCMFDDAEEFSSTAEH